jgi:protein disulfide-isomerase
MSNKERKPMLFFVTNLVLEQGLLESDFNIAEFAPWSRDNVILVKLDLTDDSSNDFLDRNTKVEKKLFEFRSCLQYVIPKATIRKDKINYESM